MAKKSKITPKEQERVLMQPTIYRLNMLEVPLKKYTEAFEIILHNPDFAAQIEKRNRLLLTADRMRQNSQEKVNLIRIIQQYDRRLADIIFATLVQCCVHSRLKNECVAFSTLLKYYVDYTREGIPEKVDRLARNLDKVTFLSDMLEDILTNISGDMEVIFNGEIQFRQFEGVKNVLTQLRGFFNSTRSKEVDTPDANLYIDYAESINKYLDMRLKTYTEKYRKMHPAQQYYTDNALVDALIKFFETDKFFGLNFIKHTDSGGCYIDAVAVAFNLTPEQTVKLDHIVFETPKDNSVDAVQRYSFAVTDAIMKEYHKV